MRLKRKGLLLLCLLNVMSAVFAATLQDLQAGWTNPARTYKPHTRWWWPGNALTPADITWQLEQMAAQGIGGVEIMSAYRMYETGNADFLSADFLNLLKHAVAEAKRLDLEVAVTFGPGWSFGGPGVPKEDQSKVLSVSSVDLKGDAPFSGSLPLPAFKPCPHNILRPPASPGSVIAVVAGRVTPSNQLDADSLTVLSGHLKPGTAELAWAVPPGTWRLMAFWLTFTGQECQAQKGSEPAMVIDHLSQGAVQRHCEHLGGTFAKTFGPEFGRTVDSFFCDSFEVMPYPDTLLWSNETLAGFEKHAGYDLTRYLPALWFDIGPQTPRVRYDLGSYLSDEGLRVMFNTFNGWCQANQVQARIQPHYRYLTEIVQAAGATARPETEVTTTRFEPLADPRKATASGARFYGRDILSAEAYTFIRPSRYSTTMQELKIATDAFLRDGVTQFYNHGYFASPEMHVAPTRDMPWANRISHWNTWWKYYRHLAGYVSRCCYLLRQGRFVADVLIYSPQATAWSERSVWGTDRRVQAYGDLAKTLVSNGYDFDIVNDDLLQHRARFRDGGAELNSHTYRILLLPRATVLPLETLHAVRDFVKAGGTLIALDALPASAAGLTNAEPNDRELTDTVSSLFAAGSSGPGTALFIPEYKIVRTDLNPKIQPPFQPTPTLSAPQRRLLDALRRVTPPDVALAGGAPSDGLTFIHTRVADTDVYFVCNLQPNRVATDVTFRVTGKTPQRWNALTGETGKPVPGFRADAAGTTIPLDFEPWESAFFLFTPGVVPEKGVPPHAPLPAPLPLAGAWQVRLEGYGFETFESAVTTLASWTDAPRTRHFSGTGRYETEFTLPAERLAGDARMVLDLGAVGDVAEVELNGQALGVAWMAPYRIDITRAARAGRNKLVVFVTNQLVNYVSGLKDPPEVPLALQPRLGTSKPELYAESRRAKNDMSNTNLPPSGLLGPVQIVWRAIGE